LKKHHTGELHKKGTIFTLFLTHPVDLIQTLTDEALQGTVVNRTYDSIDGEGQF